MPIPGWEEDFHVPLRRRPTPQQLVLLTRAARSGDDQQLSAADRAWLRQRRLMLERAEASGVPYWRQVAVGALTTLDNVEDQVSTVAWLGAAAINRIPVIGRALTGALRGTSTALDRMQQALSAPLPGRAAKNKHDRARRVDARRERGLVGGLQRGLGWMEQRQGKLLEAAQASDTWFGVGLTLGAVMGAIEETYWRTGAQAYYTAMSLGNGAIAELLPAGARSRAAVQAIADEYTRAGLAAPPAPPVEWALEFSRALAHPERERRLWGVVAQFASLGAAEIALDDGDAALVSLAGTGVAIATDRALGAIAGALRPEQIRDLIVPSARVRDGVTRALLEAWGAPLDPRGGVGGEWASPELTLGEHVDLQLSRQHSLPATWLPEDTGTDRAQLVHQLVRVGMDATMMALTGAADGYDRIPAPEDDLYYRMIDAAIVLPAQASSEDLAAYQVAMLAARDRDPDAWRRGGLARLSFEYWAR
jgi:hypothetical protein